MTLRGTVEVEDYGPGVHILATDDGERYAICTDKPHTLRAGDKVEIDGTILEQGQIGIGLTGDFVIKVDKIKRL